MLTDFCTFTVYETDKIYSVIPTKGGGCKEKRRNGKT